MPRRSAFKLFGPRGAPLIRQSRKPFRIAQLYHIGNISVKQHFKLNNVLQFFEPANNIRGEAMITAGAGIGVLLEPLTSFVNDYLRNDDVQDFGCKNRLPPAANFVFAFPTPAAWHLTP